MNQDHRPDSPSIVCECGKAAFATRAAAQRQAKVVCRTSRHRKHGNREMLVYRCHGGVWHFTAQSQRNAARAAEVRADARGDVAPMSPRRDRPVSPRRPVSRPKLRAVVKLKPQRDPRPARTACVGCGRRWLSDLDPSGRACPQCGGEIRVGRDADRFENRRLAA